MQTENALLKMGRAIAVSVQLGLTPCHDLIVQFPPFCHQNRNKQCGAMDHKQQHRISNSSVQQRLSDNSSVYSTGTVYSPICIGKSLFPQHTHSRPFSCSAGHNLLVSSIHRLHPGSVTVSTASSTLPANFCVDWCCRCHTSRSTYPALLAR